MRQPTVRIDFVEMLFALAIAHIAVQITTLCGFRLTPLNAPASYMHSLLALIVVATSWVGWTWSKAPGNRQDVTKVFSLPFLVLLLDVFLVILYYIIANGVDVPGADGLRRPSAHNETLGVLLVFLLYLLWDVLTKAFMTADGNEPRFWGRVRTRLIPRAWITLLCLGLAAFCYRFQSMASREASVVAVDASLLMIVLLFRVVKQFQGGRRWLLGTAFLFAYVVCATVTHYLERP